MGLASVPPSSANNQTFSITLHPTIKYLITLDPTINCKYSITLDPTIQTINNSIAFAQQTHTIKRALVLTFALVDTTATTTAAPGGNQTRRHSDAPFDQAVECRVRINVSLHFRLVHLTCLLHFAIFASLSFHACHFPGRLRGQQPGRSATKKSNV